MGSRLIVFDPDSLLKLLVHYSDGLVPLGSAVVSVAASQHLPRWVDVTVESKDWEGKPFETGDGYGTIQPLFIRYEGKRIMVLDHLKDVPVWSETGAVEAPKRQ